MEIPFPTSFIQEPTASGTATGLTKAEEVVLTLPDKLTSGTAINIQTGVYAGGGPATVEGTATLTLPVAFDTDALVQVIINGLEQKKPEDVSRTSSTQLTFSDKLKKNTIIKVRTFS